MVKPKDGSTMLGTNRRASHFSVIVWAIIFHCFTSTWRDHPSMWCFFLCSQQDLIGSYATFAFLATLLCLLLLGGLDGRLVIKFYHWHSQMRQFAELLFWISYGSWPFERYLMLSCWSKPFVKHVDFIFKTKCICCSYTSMTLSSLKLRAFQPYRRGGCFKTFRVKKFLLRCRFLGFLGVPKQWFGFAVIHAYMGGFPKVVVPNNHGFSY